MRFSRVAPIALILFAVAGCTSDGGSDPTNPPSTPAPPSTSVPVNTPPPSTPTPSIATTGPNVRPGEKPPVLSTLAKKRTVAGAITFAQFWFRALDWAYATTDAGLLKLHSASSCTDCARAARIFDTTQAVRQHFVGGRVYLISATVAPNDGRNDAERAIDVAIGQRPLRTVDAHNKVVGRAPAVEKITFRLWLKWTGSSWIAVQKGHVT